MDPVTAAALIAAGASILTTLLQRSTKKKVDETHKQTTQNGHKHDPPTIPDLLANLSTRVEGLHERMDRHEELHRQN